MQMQFGSWRIAVEQIRPNRVELAQKYNELAVQWQAIISRFGYPRTYATLFHDLNRAGALADLQAGSHVLDAGIGTGAMSAGLLQVIEHPVHIHGLDISSQMLAQSAECLNPFTQQLTLAQRDIAHTAYPNNYFDAVISAHTVEHLADPTLGLLELVRVLRPGAPLVLVISRQHVFSLWLRWHWAIKQMTPLGLSDCMSTIGLENVRLCPLKGTLRSRWMSLACIGIKPDFSLE